MEKRKQKLRYYPSFAAFHLGGSTVTSYPSGCQRNILFTSFGIRTESIPALYMSVGQLNEERHERTLLGWPDVLQIEREMPVRGSIAGSDSVEYSGRIDFWVTTTDGNEEPHECKATVSRTGFQVMKRKGEPKLNHLAQLVSYLIQQEVQDGRLVYGCYEHPYDPTEQDMSLVCTDSLTFRVRIEDDGCITVDGKPTPYTALDQLRHMQQTVKTLTTREFGPRPAVENEWSSPCRMCPFQNTCSQIDVGAADLEQALESAENDIKNAVEREPNVYRPKRKPKGA